MFRFLPLSSGSPVHLSKGPTRALLATEVMRANCFAESRAAFARNRSWAGRDLRRESNLASSKHVASGKKSIASSKNGTTLEHRKCATWSTRGPICSRPSACHPNGLLFCYVATALVQASPRCLVEERHALRAGEQISFKLISSGYGRLKVGHP